MNYWEEKRDLFSVDFNIWTPAHCISSDCKMGAGIAVPMKKQFGLAGLVGPLEWPGCLYYNGVLNLVTKNRYFHKPTLRNMEIALRAMRQRVVDYQITHIVMPKIGAGLDRLPWPSVREQIQLIFNNIVADILVCKQ